MWRNGPQIISLAAVIVIVLLLPSLGTSAMVLASGATAVILVVYVLRSKPTALLFLWSIVVLATPPWISFYLVGFRIPVAAAVSVAIIAVLMGRTPNRWTLADTLVALLAVTAVMATSGFGSPLHLTTQVLFEWVCCYGAGRMLSTADFVLVGSRVGGVLGWLAVLQVALQLNFARYWPFSYSSDGSQWSVLQERGDQIRAEVTLGHSIALGAVLTMLLPFALSKVRTLIDKILVAGILIGVLATFSRSAMLAALIVVLLSIIFSEIDTVRKIGALAICAGGAWLVLRYFTDTVGSSTNSVELTDSTAYREGLLGIVGQVRPLGLAGGAIPAADGVTYKWGRYYSIDNGLLYLGLYLGLVCALLFVALLAWVLSKSIKRRSFLFSAVLLSQLPFILTVAPITQYQNVLWLLLGAAVHPMHGRRTPSNRNAAEAEQPDVKHDQRARVDSRHRLAAAAPTLEEI